MREKTKKATTEFDTLYSLCELLGLPINSKKVVPPTQVMTCIGILIDIDTGKMSILGDKCTQIFKACVIKTFITKKQLQCLLGRLIYLHHCIKPACVFVNRLLNNLMDSTSYICVNDQMKCDLHWFIHLLHHLIITHISCFV